MIGKEFTAEEWKKIEEEAVTYVPPVKEKVYTINDLYTLATKFNEHYSKNKYPLTSPVIEKLIKEIK